MTKPPVAGSDMSVDSEEAEIVQELQPYLKPDRLDQGIKVAIGIVRKAHSGPLPAPEDFEHYESVLPGAAERIFRLTENEQAHRHKQEGRIVLGEFAVRLVGQLGALAALALLVALVGFCAYIGQPIAAGVITAIGAIVIGYVKYSAQRVDEPEQPAPPKPAPKTKRKRR